MNPAAFIARRDRKFQKKILGLYDLETKDY
jgi:hypothetical protein